MTSPTAVLVHQSKQDMQHDAIPFLHYAMSTIHKATAAGISGVLCNFESRRLCQQNISSCSRHGTGSHAALPKQHCATQNTQLLQQTSDGLTWLRCSCDRAAGRSACIHESLRGLQPIWPGSTYTMPHLLTVAGDATTRSCTSKIMFCCTHTAVSGQLGE